MTRKRFSAKAYMARLGEYGNRCADCKCKTGGAAGLDWDHILPLAMGGDDDLTNLQPLCLGCHRAKTKTDAKDIGKARRMDQRNAGIKRQPRTSILGSVASGWKKTFTGEWIKR
jgi:5-methylcytosine-specific restriction protein A